MNTFKETLQKYALNTKKKCQEEKFGRSSQVTKVNIFSDGKFLNYGSLKGCHKNYATLYL